MRLYRIWKCLCFIWMMTLSQIVLTNEGESIHSPSDDHDETNRPYHICCSLSYRQSQGMVTLITSSVWFGHRIFNWLDDDAGLA
jgi:hypothetical protein